ncbi:MAG: hypothetical protein ACRDHO_10260, partial [Actinomycetota bacterium]
VQRPPRPTRMDLGLDVKDGQIVCGSFLLRLVDEGDIGDLYNFCPTGEAPPAGPSSCERSGEFLLAGFNRLLVELNAQQIGDRFIHLGVAVENGRPDHRLRLHIALAEPVTGSVALSPFEVVERPLQSEGGTETPSPTWPARGAVLAGDVAVIQDGVFEYEVLPDPPELAITLLRCVGTISRPEIATRGWAAGPDIPTPDAQMLGHTYLSLWMRTGLVPDDLVRAWEEGTLSGTTARARGGGDLPDTGSLLDIEGAELSSVRKVDGHIEVRIWNPTSETRDARVAGRAIRLGPARIETIRLD